MARIRAILAFRESRVGVARVQVGAYERESASGLLRYDGRLPQLHASALSILRRLLEVATAVVPLDVLRAGLWG